jgi:hypothetical protein
MRAARAEVMACGRPGGAGHLSRAKTGATELGQRKARAFELRAKGREIELEDVTDEHSSLKTSRELARKLGKARRFLEHRRGDVVNVTCGDRHIARWRDQGGPFGDDMTDLVELDDRALDNPVRCRIKARCLDVDHRVARSVGVPRRCGAHHDLDACRLAVMAKV